MAIQPFKLERYFAKYEFSVRILMSSSDCESLAMSELLAMASPEMLQLWNTLRLGYTESQGHPQLRAAVAEMYRGVPAEQVMIAAPEEAIYIAMQTLLNTGDHVIALVPAYQSLHEVARSMGCEVTPWRLEAAGGAWRLDLQRLQESITPRTRLLVLNFPNNPTGYLPSRAEFDAIVETARRHGLYIFLDEMYRLLESDAALRLPSICEAYEKGIALSGLSKSFALPGLRIGWLATQESALLERWLAFKDYTTICSSAPSEILGIIAVQNREAITRRNLEIIQGNLAAAEGFFAALPQLFAWHRPLAGSIAFPRWLGPGSVEDFCQSVLEEQGVMIVPGSLFDYPGGHFRIGLGRKNFCEAVEHVQAFLEK